MSRAAAATSISAKALAGAFSRNLRRHVDRLGSISALCRACGVNRQQFNKYLNGETLPSLHNLVKIATTLEVGIDDLVSGARGGGGERGNPVLRLEGLVRREQRPITTGYYLDYAISAVFQDSLLVSICKIARDDGGYACRLRLIIRSPAIDEVNYITYRGMAFASQDAVYLYYAHEAHVDDLVYCILQPDLRYSADLVGVRTALSNTSPPIPFSASNYLRHLGERPNLRWALRQCGVFALDDLDAQQARYLARLDAKTQTAKNSIRISHG